MNHPHRLLKRGQLRGKRPQSSPRSIGKSITAWTARRHTAIRRQGVVVHVVGAVAIIGVGVLIGRWWVRRKKPVMTIVGSGMDLFGVES